MMNSLDLRGNEIIDLQEISRLTAAPNMQNIYVANNPFTRSHSSTYRVSIFNFFRATPGFTEDIQIDGSGPGMVERRHLIERVFEKPPSTQRFQSHPPLVPKPPPSVPTEQGGTETTSPIKEVGTNEAQTLGRTPKKKKGNRQRIVSLDGSITTIPPESVREVDSDIPISPGSGGEEYRKRLEALREEAGAGWLRVLSESGGLQSEGNGKIQSQPATGGK
jgi:hypothetical protein